MKKDKNPLQFPSIYRIITESLVFKNLKSLSTKSKKSKSAKFTLYFLIFDFFVFLIILILVSAVLFFKIYKNSLELRKISLQRNEIKNEISFWQSVLQKYPGYKDAYLRMAILEYSLGDLEKAKNDNQQALLLDPNYKDAKNLENLINKK